MSGLDRLDVILIGPTGAGKSTVGRLLADRLRIPLVSLDQVRFAYYAEIGYDMETATRLRREDYEGLLRYWEPFDAHAVVRALADYPGSVFDFGAIHSVYDDPTLLQRVEDALAPYPNVILLLPSADPEESVRLLHERGRAGAQLDQATLDMWERIIRRFVTHPSNYRLAKETIYTAGQTPLETAEAVLTAVRPR
jgi:hypothetical protein